MLKYNDPNNHRVRWSQRIRVFNRKS